MNRKSIIFLKVLISLLIITFLLYFIGFKKVFDTILRTNPPFLPIILLLYFLAISISSLNIFILLKPLRYKIKFFRILKLNFLSWSLGVITPAKIGHFSITYFLKKEGVNLGDATAIAVLDKIISLSMTFIFFVLGFALFFSINDLIIAVFAILVAAAIPSFFLLREKGRYIIKRFLLRSHAVKFKGFSKCLSSYVKKFKRYILMDYISTFFGFLINSLVLLTLFISFNEYTSLFNVMRIRAITTFAGLIPITIDGLGIIESLGVFLFGKVGLTAPVVITSYLIARIIGYIAAGILLSSLFKRKMITEITNKTKKSSTKKTF